MAVKQSSEGGGSSVYLDKKQSPEVFYFGDITSRVKKISRALSKESPYTKNLIIFLKEITFPRKWQKKFWETGAIFERKGHLTSKINTTFFYHKLDVKYLHVKQFFQKKKNSIFRGNCKKLLWGRIWPFSRERGRLSKKLI